MVTPQIELHDITVRFGALLALDAVSLTIPAGARVAVVGENGAGKSTLMKVLFGLLPPDAGEIRRDQQPCRFASPREAIEAGIGMVQQHFDLIGSFTVAENIVLGAEHTKGLRLDQRAAIAAVERLSQESGLAVDPRARVETLSIAAQQRVEILKALYRRARVLILDEPTATLAPDEARELWSATRRLSAAGTSLVFITHKLDEVMANADTVLVLRRGRPILTSPVSETTPAALAAAMIGSVPVAQGSLASPPRAPAGNAALTLHGLTVRASTGQWAIEDLTLSISPGEVVGLAGVDGSGQLELIEALIGLRPIAGGEILLGECPLQTLSIAARRAAGMAFVPEDRHRHAVALRMSVAENAVLGRHREPVFQNAVGALRKSAIRAFLSECTRVFDIRGSEAPEASFATLSGGNQQKLVLARELSRQPRVLIASQPTRGLDFAATRFIHERLRQAAHEGAAVLVQSLDLEEILALSDRIAVLLKGKLVGILRRDEAREESLGALMTGGKA